MTIDDDVIKHAIFFLKEGQENEAAEALKKCRLDNWHIMESWDDMPNGVIIDLVGSRKAYDALNTNPHPIGDSIKKAFSAVISNDLYLSEIRIRVEATESASEVIPTGKLNISELKELIEKIEELKELMTKVATGQAMINDVNQIYKEKRIEINQSLDLLRIKDVNSYPDLWAWYERWSDGSLPTYQSRRVYLISLYQPLLDGLQKSTHSGPTQIDPPTGWARLDRNLEKIGKVLETAQNEEDYQSVGLLCREAMISLAQAVYNPETDDLLGGIKPSSTDAKRMLETFIIQELRDSSHKIQRNLIRTTYELAVKLQHQRNAAFRDAALCAEALRSLTNAVAIIAGKRDPKQRQSKRNNQ